MADRAMEIMGRADRVPELVFRAVIRRADIEAKLTPAGAIALIQQWLPLARSGDYQAWLWGEMAEIAFRSGEIETGLAFGARACTVAEQYGEPVVRTLRRMDLARLLLHCGRAREALPLLEIKSPPVVELALVRAQAMHALGEAGAAHAQLLDAYRMLDEVSRVDASMAPQMRPLLDALAREL